MSEVNDLENGENSQSILEKLLANAETKSQVVDQFKRLAKLKTRIVQLQDSYKLELKSTTETLNISSPYVTTVVDALVKDTVGKKVKENSLKCDLLSIFLEGSDEDFGEDEE